MNTDGQAVESTTKDKKIDLVDIDIKNITSKVTPKIFYGGKFHDSISGKTFPVIDPRTGETILNCAEGSAADIDEAVKVAREAFENGPWPKMSGSKRGAIIYKFAELLEKNSEELIQLECLNSGKTLSYATMIDMPVTISNFRYFAGWADKIQGKTIPVNGNFFAYTLHEPIGVIGQIIPWNFPMVMVAWKVAPALACGNTVVVKCAEETPLTALRMAELAMEAGVPPGVFNVVPGYGETAGAALVKHPNVDKIAFTGSTEVGKEIMRSAAETLKRISLELGGKSPVIVFPDCDIDQAVNILHWGVFSNQGQCCNAATRIFVHEDIYDQFVEKAAKIASESPIGDPFSSVYQGPQINEMQYNKILGYIESGKREGARLVCGGSNIGNKGFFIEQTVFADVTDEMKIAKEEIFGPVQSLLKFKDTDEVVRRANATNYGLAAAIFTKDINVANTISRVLKAGIVWINSYSFIDNAVPFGGYKMSGIGRELGEYALSLYTEVKSVLVPLENSAWL